MSTATAPDFLKLFDLTGEQLSALEEARRGEKLQRLAEFANQPLSKVFELAAQACSIQLVPPERFDLKRLQSIPVRILHEFHCVPVLPEAFGEDEAAEAVPPAAEEQGLILATAWPWDEVMDDWIYAACGSRAHWVWAHPERITDFITQNLGVGAESLDDSFDLEAEMALVEEEDEEDEDAAIIRFVNEVFNQAVHSGATDIHFEPMEDQLRIRYRIDGLLVPVPVPENLRRFQDAIVSRLKIMAKLNISEKRLPQDGRIVHKMPDTTLDIRLSTMPVMYGESISLRLLNKKSKPLSLAQLGMSPEDEARVNRALNLPHGIILVTGPTGSGKSTSLNAFIRSINAADTRIITVEDPIEYEVPGVNQVQVKSDIGFGFPEALRHVLRQDPNVVMVGEIRDRETADIAVRASLTGHLVFSTLHTNDAAGAITRLTDMGIEPFLIASSVEMVIAQRLLRRLCQKCLTMKDADPYEVADALKVLDLPARMGEGVLRLPHSPGCEACRNIGYRGRIGIYEILRVTEDMHDPIVKRAAAPVIRDLGLKAGMVSLGHSGWNLVQKQLTTLEEVVRTISVREGE